jgi:hypothetical protein
VWKEPAKILHVTDIRVPLFRWMNEEQIFSKMVWGAKAGFRGGKQGFDEIWTGKWFQNVCRAVPVRDGIEPLIVIVGWSVDETHLSLNGMCKLLLKSTGDGSACPMRVWPNNIPWEHQQNPFFRDTLAYMVKMHKKDIPVKSHRSYCKTLVYHRQFEIINRPFLEIWKRGMWCD